MTKCPNCDHDCRPDDSECEKCGTDLVLVKSRIEKEESEAAERQKEKKQKVAKLVDLIKKMDESQLMSLLGYAEELHGKKKRIHDRISCMITADCLHQGRASNNYVKDISFGGLFIETTQPFNLGEEITMTLSLSHHVKPFKLTGIIVRTSPQGVGLEFKDLTQVQQEMVQEMVKKVEKFKK
ncbi:MAG: PilZ domain-containing protein [Deltaproteobacteria bacterium]|nr:PilZ domain-containing protein [Deltaproteobacteria bacterium]